MTPLNVLVDIMESEKLKINQFIKLFGRDKRYLEGLCYWFAYILKGRFPDGDIWYDPILCHFYFVLNEDTYDVRGCVDLPTTAIKWSDYQKFDLSDYKRVVKYCILKEGE